MMTETSPKLSSSGGEERALQSGPNRETYPTQTFPRSLSNEWYIRVKVELRGDLVRLGNSKIVTEMGERIANLHDGT